VAGGGFREDLYYRLNVITLQLPPLRERREDIPLLVERFVAKFAAELGRRPVTVDPQALALFESYPWPGNVRELRNVVERLVLIARGRSPRTCRSICAARARHSRAPGGVLARSRYTSSSSSRTRAAAATGIAALLDHAQGPLGKRKRWGLKHQ
jgi:DNA-binding NtrC family response regulator